MATSFHDHYRPLRLALRLDGLVVGLGLGLAMLLFPSQAMSVWGLAIEHTAWPTRLGGACLTGCGLNILAVAQDDTMRSRSLLAIMMLNILVALVLFFSYIQGDLTNLTGVGQVALLAIFVICLTSAVLPIYYFRQDLAL